MPFPPFTHKNTPSALLRTPLPVQSYRTASSRYAVSVHPPPTPSVPAPYDGHDDLTRHGRFPAGGHPIWDVPDKPGPLLPRPVRRTPSCNYSLSPSAEGKYTKSNDCAAIPDFLQCHRIHAFLRIQKPLQIKFRVRHIPSFFIFTQM